MEYPRTFALPEPLRVPPTALLISSSDKFIEQLTCNYSIVERERGRTNSLVRLVSFAGDDNRIVRFRLVQSRPDRLTAIGNNRILGALQAFFNLCNDRYRNFGPRVVGCNNDKIAALPRHFAHGPPL